MRRPPMRHGGVNVRRALLLVNPHARRAKSALESAMSEFSRLGVACDAVVSRMRGHAGEVAAANSADYDAIFALGGDGTAIEVMDALTADSPPVGVLPGGTGNLLARALGIPLSVRRAVRALVAGDEAQVDLGRLGDGRRFVIGAGVGIDASMIASTPTEWKRRAGVLAYVMSGTRHVLKRRRFTATVTADGAVMTRQAGVVLVANFGVLLNGLISLGDGILTDDGLLDVCIFDPASIGDAVRIASKLLLRDFSADPAMSYMRGSRISVETDRPYRFQADGELIGTTPFVAVVDPLAGRLLVPHCQINRQ
ncbi:MAG: diacylglycerol kinase family lipid kinase [Gemmatimonadota bacterium]|nr:diacylglycerol kinase family lipid kinase [Gemmatimonadota bacterium]